MQSLDPFVINRSEFRSQPGNAGWCTLRLRQCEAALFARRLAFARTVRAIALAVGLPGHILYLPTFIHPLSEDAKVASVARQVSEECLGWL